MSHRKQPIPAAHISGLVLDDEGRNVLTALATGGQRGTDGRPVYLSLTDTEIRGIIARLTLDPRWSPAIDEAARIGFPLGDQASPGEHERARRRLTAAMADVMTRTEPSRRTP